jgi:hypothetical protein
LETQRVRRLAAKGVMTAALLMPRLQQLGQTTTALVPRYSLKA